MRLTNRSIRTWEFVHKWSSLISTAFLLMLCLTGLPLIFHHEIEDLVSGHPESVETVDTSKLAPIQPMLDTAKADRPDEVIPFISFDDEHPVVLVVTLPSYTSHFSESHYYYFDQHTGKQLDKPPANEGFMYVMFRLHYDMFAGILGTLFLGLMALFVVVAIASGVVLYAPFMRRLDFGTVRNDRSRRVQWLDLHNLLGIVTVVWLLVVSITGAINTLAQPVQMMWGAGQLADMTKGKKGQPEPKTLCPIDDAIAAAKSKEPDMRVQFVALPKSTLSSPHHYSVFLVGDDPLTSRILKPAVIDAETGELVDIREMPLYVKTLFVSQPLHFGDYGGMPLKIIWAVLDIITIVVLITGLYIWLKKRSLVRAARKLAERESRKQEHAEAGATP